MNVSFSPEEANATVAALRLRATVLESHLPGIGHLHIAAEWLAHEVALMTQAADKIEFFAAQEWLDRKAAMDALQGSDMTDAELRTLSGVLE